ncbi:hypothetical protein [Metabacillus sp. SLBN-84]
MMQLEHPAIQKMNRDGHLAAREEEMIAGTCPCGEALNYGRTVVEFQDELFCDDDCLTEAICGNPTRYGVEKRRLS